MQSRITPYTALERLAKEKASWVIQLLGTNNQSAVPALKVEGYIPVQYTGFGHMFLWLSEKYPTKLHLYPWKKILLRDPLTDESEFSDPIFIFYLIMTTDFPWSGKTHR